MSTTKTTDANPALPTMTDRDLAIRTLLAAEKANELASEQLRLARIADRQAETIQAAFEESNRRVQEDTAAHALERGPAFPVPVSATFPLEDGESVTATFDVQCTRLTAADIELDERYRRNTPGQRKVQGISWPSFKSAEADAVFQARVLSIIGPNLDEARRTGRTSVAEELIASAQGQLINGNDLGVGGMFRVHVFGPLMRRCVGRCLEDLVREGTLRIVESPAAAQ
jgi:hypothetical protein